MTEPLCFKTVAEWLGYLESIHSSEIDMGLDRIMVVYRQLSLDFSKTKVITVAGTNGKGSTVATLAALLKARSKTFACYTSPHIDVFNERITVNGVLVSDEDLINAFAAVEKARRTTTLTYFEFTTLAAFYHFAQHDSLEYLLLEVGLGGRLDAVNLIDPDLSIITSIGIDHVDWLGDSRELIGYEKAGIFRSGGKAVVGDLSPPNSVLQQADAQAVDVKYAGNDFYYDESISEMVFQLDNGVVIRTPFTKQNIPVTNQMCAVQALITLGEIKVLDDVAVVLSNIRVAGRMEQISADPLIIVDVAHNPQAAHYLKEKLTDIVASQNRVIAVFSSMADKDIKGVQSALECVVDEWIIFPLNMARAASVDALSEYLVNANHCFTVEDSVDDAITKINDLKLAYDDAMFIVCGSFYTVSAIKYKWNDSNG